MGSNNYNNNLKLKLSQNPGSNFHNQSFDPNVDNLPAIIPTKFIKYPPTSSRNQCVEIMPDSMFGDNNGMSHISIEEPSSYYADDLSYPEPQEQHSLEIFFGDVNSFHSLHAAVCDGDHHPSRSAFVEEDCKIKQNPDSIIHKTLLVANPLISFEGINKFPNLVESCVTNCKIQEAKWSDFDGLHDLQKLRACCCHLEKIEPFQFNALRVLSVTRNKLNSLSFLGQGIPTLEELNVARNYISCLHEEQLHNCFALHTINLSGNPLCTIQDISALKVLSNLKNLQLIDSQYGKCPIATLCDGKVVILSALNNLQNLNGNSITPCDLTTVHDYVFTRSLFYFVNYGKRSSEQVGQRKAAISSMHKVLELLGYRILQLTALYSRVKRTLATVEILPLFSNTKLIMKDYINKIQERVVNLNEDSKLRIQRLETIMQISRWEQVTEKWLKWIEFQTFGNIQHCLIHSVHEIASSESNELLKLIHQLVGSLTCAELWPKTTLVKVESVISIRDKGMEIGIQKTFEHHFQLSNEPPYCPPPEIDYSLEKPIPPENPRFPFYTFPLYQSHRNIPTYTTQDYKPDMPMHFFPDSVIGLPDKPQQLYMFLVTPKNSTCANSLVFLQQIMTEKFKQFKDIRVTNCLWSANPARTYSTFSVAVVVKVLSNCLQAVSCDKPNKSCNHNSDCTCYSLTYPHSIAPAFVIVISYTPGRKSFKLNNLPGNDDDIILSAEAALAGLASKISSRDTALALEVYTPSKKSLYLQKSGDDGGLHADLSTMHVSLSLDKFSVREPHANLFTSPNGDGSNFITKFLGADIQQLLTSLNLEGNKIGLIIGLKGLTSLKSLNLSHNNLTTLFGLERMPQLIELKLGWNSLRFLLSNAKTLGYAVPRLLTLEILPNPFQDIRDIIHIPAILRRELPLVHRIDLWKAPFPSISQVNGLYPLLDAEAGFAHIAMAKSWNGTLHACNDFASQSLTQLSLPKLPPIPEELESNGLDLNLSDNYIGTIELADSQLIKRMDWRERIVKLQLQENMINNLEWMNNVIFPNLQILNLSDNFLYEIHGLEEACPNLRHVQLCGNLLKKETSVLNPLKALSELTTLDCSRCPVSSCADYSSFVLANMKAVQILDGIPIEEWEFSNALNQIGGALTQEWLDTKLRAYNSDTSSETALSLTNCSLQKISVSSKSFSKLASLNLEHNQISTLTNLSQLPNLRVLGMSFNQVNSLGASPCPTCYANTVVSQVVCSQKLRNAKIMELKSQKPYSNVRTIDSASAIAGKGSAQANSSVITVSLPASQMTLSTRRSSPILAPATTIFPQLEIFVLSHNGLTALADLHFHAMPTLHTLFLSCNNLASLHGLENIPTLQALVLDNNNIRDVPHNCLVGCKSLKYLHLEHNRLTAIPRVAHLPNLDGLFLAYNKIQNLSGLENLNITECSVKGNSVAAKSDHRLVIAAKNASVNILDGKDLVQERTKLEQLQSNLFSDSIQKQPPARNFPGTPSYARNHPNQTRDQRPISSFNRDKYDSTRSAGSIQRTSASSRLRPQTTHPVYQQENLRNIADNLVDQLSKIKF